MDIFCLRRYTNDHKWTHARLCRLPPARTCSLARARTGRKNYPQIFMRHLWSFMWTLFISSYLYQRNDVLLIEKRRFSFCHINCRATISHNAGLRVASYVITARFRCKRSSYGFKACFFSSTIFAANACFFIEKCGFAWFLIAFRAENGSDLCLWEDRTL